MHSCPRSRHASLLWTSMGSAFQIILFLIFSSAVVANESSKKEKTTDATEKADATAIDDCDFTVSNAATTKDKTNKADKAAKDDPLLAKLAQFDECLDRIGANSSGQGAEFNGTGSGNSGSFSAKHSSSDASSKLNSDEGAKSGTANPDDSQAQTASQTANSEADKIAKDDSLPAKLAKFDERLDRMGASASGEDAKSGTDDPDDSQMQSASQTTNEEVSQIEGSDDTVLTETVPHAQVTPERIAAEDNVAKVLREAAEAETDPELKKELWAEYENYMKSIGK